MATQARSGTEAKGRRLNSPVALTAGAVFALLGLAGFLSGGGYGPGPDGDSPFGAARLAMLPDVLHVAVGAALVAAGILGARPARCANLTVGIAYVAAVLIGPLTGADLIVDGANHALHLGLGVALTAVGLRGDRELP